MQPHFFGSLNSILHQRILDAGRGIEGDWQQRFSVAGSLSAAGLTWSLLPSPPS